MNSAQDTKVSINLAEGIQRVDFRTGSLPDLPKPKPVGISGNIFAPRDFVKKRKHIIDAKHKDVTYVYVNRREMSIDIRIDEMNPESYYHISGKLRFNPDLAVFSINQNKEYTLTDLTKIIRFNRRFFASNEDHQQILKGLMSFSANSTSQVESRNDNRGNMKNLQEKQSNINFAPYFILEMPIFEGVPASKFEAEVCFNLDDKGAKFWLESTELAEKTEAIRDETIEQALEGLRDYALIEA